MHRLVFFAAVSALLLSATGAWAAPGPDGPNDGCPAAMGARAGMQSHGARIVGGRGVRPGPGGTTAIGPKPDEPRVAHGGQTSIGPKPDEPRTARGGPGGSVSIGPKPDEPRNPSLASRGGPSGGPGMTGRAAVDCQARPK
jgi:hypothetical protein